MEISKNELVNEGLKLLDDALCQFNKVEGCSTSSSICKIIHELILLVESIYFINKK